MGIGERGKGKGGIGTDCCATTEFYTSESQEWDGEGGYAWHELADNHHLFGILGDEFRCHFV